MGAAKPNWCLTTTVQRLNGSNQAKLFPFIPSSSHLSVALLIQYHSVVLFLAGYQGGSDSVNDVSVTGSCGSRGKLSSSICSDDTISTSTFTQEPPGTPPPPYASTSQLCPADEVDENYSIIPEDVSVDRRGLVMLRFVLSYWAGGLV